MGLVESIAQAYRDVGAAKAQGAANRGAIFGGTLASLGQTIAGIPAARAQEQAQQQERQLRGLQLQQGQMQLLQAQRAQAAQDALNAAYTNALSPNGDVDMTKLAAGVANTPAASEWPKIQAGIAEAQAKGAALRKTQGEIAAQEADHMAAIANAADTAPDAPSKAALLTTLIGQGIKSGVIPPDHGQTAIQQLLGPDGQPDPTAVTQTIAHMKQLSAADTEKRAQAASAAAEQKNREAQLPGLQAEAAVKQQVAAGTVNGLTPEQQGTQRNQELTRQQEAERIGLEKKRTDLEQQRVGLEGQRLKGETAPPLEIKPGTPEFRIAQDLASGKMTFAQFRTLAAYNRNAALKFGIYDQARQLNPEFDPAQYELGFKMAANPQVRQRIVAINSLNPVIDQIEALANQAGNGDIPAVNKLLLGAKFQLGNRTVTNYRQLQTLLGDEVGNALGIGSGSDLKTKLGLDLVNPNLSPKAFADTMEQLRTVLDQRKQALIGQMGIYGGAANGTGGPATANTPPPGAKVRVYNPATGKFE